MSFLGITLYFYAVLFYRTRAEILRRDRGAAWVRETLNVKGNQA
jgi:hypothetical protein